MSKINYDRTVKHLKDKNKILFVLTSNRWEGHKETPKSSALAYKMQEELGKSVVTVIDVSKLKIYDCEGNVSSQLSNGCGVKESKLKDNGKDKTGELRCWCSYNNPDDELWKIVNELLISDAVVFFGSIRWGKMNGVYSRLIERLTWIESRHTTLGEDNIVKDIEVGVISIGHNWNGKEAVDLEKKVLTFFGFKTPNPLFWSYQWTTDSSDETKGGYVEDVKDFQDEFQIMVKESVIRFRDFI
jgi:multimeric flavodoxin WrbA